MHLTHPSKECPERRNVPRQQCSLYPAQRHPPWGTSLKQDYIDPGAEVPFSYRKGALPSHALKSYIAQNEYLILIFAPRVYLFLIHERQSWHFIIKKREGNAWKVTEFCITRGVHREGSGTPLQYSCLENPMDGGAWWAAVHGVTKSQT